MRTLTLKDILVKKFHGCYLQKTIENHYQLNTRHGQLIIDLGLVNDEVAKNILIECQEIAETNALNIKVHVVIQPEENIVSYTPADKKQYSKFKQLTQTEVDEKCDFVYIETESGFHIALDFTYIDQVGDFVIKLPNGEEINTKDVR